MNVAIKSDFIGTLGTNIIKDQVLFNTMVYLVEEFEEKFDVIVPDESDFINDLLQVVEYGLYERDLSNSDVENELSSCITGADDLTELQFSIFSDSNSYYISSLNKNISDNKYHFDSTFSIDSGMALLKRTNEWFCIGCADVKSGDIQEVYSFKLAHENDFNADFYMTEKAVDNLYKQNSIIFWINSDGEVELDTSIFNTLNESIHDFIVSRVLDQTLYTQNLNSIQSQIIEGDER